MDDRNFASDLRRPTRNPETFAPRSEEHRCQGAGSAISRKVPAQTPRTDKCPRHTSSGQRVLGIRQAELFDDDADVGARESRGRLANRFARECSEDGSIGRRAAKRKPRLGRSADYSLGI